MAAHNNPPAGTKSYSAWEYQSHSPIASAASGEEQKQHILKSLPHGTSEYEFRGLENAQEICARERCKGYEFVLFSRVPGYMEEQISERRISNSGFRLSSYHPALNLLLAKMPDKPHERAGNELDKIMVTKLAFMGATQHLISLGGTRVKGSSRIKEPDRSYQPQTLPPGRSAKWPTLVFETGYSESRAKLQDDATWWLQESGGEVRAALTIDVERARREIIVQRWETVESHVTRRNTTGLRFEIAQSVSISRPDNQATATVTNAPLVVPFDQLFLRQPQGQEADISFTADELRSWAEGVWTSEGL